MAEEKKTTTKKTTSSSKKVTSTTKKVDAEKKATASKTTTTKAKEEPKVEKVEVKKEEKKVAAPKKKTGNKQATYTSRLLDKYNQTIKPLLKEKYHYTSIMQVPKLEKIVVNVGVGDALTNNKAIEDVVGEISLITGQRPVVTKAKKSVASFKLREGQAIGVKVTLRGVKMYEFLDKLVSIALPRVRDFRGVSRNAFDGHGNYTIGIKEQLIFPEIDYDKVNKFRGMDVTLVTTAKDDEESFSLLEALGVPFAR